MNRLFFAVTILLLLCSACGNRRIGSRLKQAEELIAADRLDSALSIIESILSLIHI